MRITDRLTAQNEVVLAQLGHLEQLIDGDADQTALAAVVKTIGAAEDDHAMGDEPALASALAHILGAGYPVLRELGQDHRYLRRLRAQIDAEGCDAVKARMFVIALRGHLEREAKDLVPLVERWVAEATLSAMAEECRPDEGGR